MKIEHRPQELFVFEIVPWEFELYPRADRAWRSEEVIIRLGLYDEHRLFHVSVSPRAGGVCGNYATLGWPLRPWSKQPSFRV